MKNIIVSTSITCLSHDKSDIIKSRRIAKIEAMRINKYKEQKIKLFKIIEINSQAYVFTSNGIRVEDYINEYFNFQIVKNCLDYLVTTGLLKILIGVV